MTTETSINVEALKKIGNEWIKGDMHRVYINGLADIYGLSTDHYNSGNICSATIDGEKVSNTTARKLASEFAAAKLWFDFADGLFHGRGFTGNHFEILVDEIKSRLNN